MDRASGGCGPFLGCHRFINGAGVGHRPSPWSSFWKRSESAIIGGNDHLVWRRHCMVGLEPITPFLGIVDHVVALVNSRKVKQKDYFDTIIDPLYTQFLPLGQDVISIYRSAEQRLRTPGLSPKRAYEAVRAERASLADARLQLLGLLEGLERYAKNKRQDDLAAFVGSMERFFTTRRLPTSYTPPPIDEDAWSFGAGGNAVAAFERRATRRTSPEYRALRREEDLQLASALNSAIRELEKSWFEIGGRYMDLKLRYRIQ